MAPSIRALRFHDESRLSLKRDGDLLFFSSSAEPTPFRKWLIDSVWAEAVIPPGASRTLEFDSREGWFCIFAPRVHALTYLVAEPGAPLEVSADFFDGRTLPAEAKVGPGRVRATVRNRTEYALPVCVMFLGGVNDEHPAPQFKMRPFLTGKRLLTSQTFRELFRAEMLGPESGVHIKNLAILFTDLQASTALYDRVGDLKALELVRRHFELLTEVVRSERGSIVKTIGDAVMAVFGEADRAVAAAARMHAAVASLSEEIALKIGVHAGSCVAIRSNDMLDYFGRTVNVAARVQGVAGGGETVVTEAVWAGPGVRDAAGRYGMKPETGTIRLKGVSDPVGVVRLRT